MVQDIKRGKDMILKALLQLVAILAHILLTS